MVPTIGTTGAFTLAAPYDTIVSPEQQLLVVAVRTIPELQASGEDPFNNIYAQAGVVPAIFEQDIIDKVTIVTFRTDGDTYIYVPANKVLSIAKLTGTKYVEKALIINLGHVPTTIDLSLVTQLVKDDIYNSLGILPNIVPTDTSSVIYVDKVKHDTLTATRDGIKTVDQSYKTRYQDLLTLYNTQMQFIANIEQVYRTNGIAG